MAPPTSAASSAANRYTAVSSPTQPNVAAAEVHDGDVRVVQHLLGVWSLP
jgi:hypothetical protein